MIWVDLVDDTYTSLNLVWIPWLKQAQQQENLSLYDVEKSEYEELSNWLTKADDVVKIVDRPTRDLEWEFAVSSL